MEKSFSETLAEVSSDSAANIRTKAEITAGAISEIKVILNVMANVLSSLKERKRASASALGDTPFSSPNHFEEDLIGEAQKKAASLMASVVLHRLTIEGIEDIKATLEESIDTISSKSSACFVSEEIQNNPDTAEINASLLLAWEEARSIIVSNMPKIMAEALKPLNTSYMKEKDKAEQVWNDAKELINSNKSE